MVVGTIALAQLFGTSLWFSANSAADDLRRAWGLGASDIGTLTSAVQLGFILGTLLFSLTGFADRFAASRIFAVCAFLGAAFNAGFAAFAHGLTTAVAFRFLVGLCLAGIYPIGMKLIVTWAPERTGSALAYLVGMLTLGTALPQFVRFAGAQWAWQVVIMTSSLLAVLAGVVILVVGDGPHLPKRGGSKALGEVLAAFKVPEFRASALGYFGHMWELYTFWTLVPMLIVRAGKELHLTLNVAGLAFALIAVGAAGCIAGGILSRRVGSAKVAAAALITSGACCVVFAAGWRHLGPAALLLVGLIWGLSVVADSPQFSALSAKACPPSLVGSALAIQNSIGFAITIVSIAAATRAFDKVGLDIAWMLVPGPILGLVAFWPLVSRSEEVRVTAATAKADP